MIEKLMSFAFSNRLLVLVLVVAIIGAGVIAFKTMAIDAFPDVTNVQVEIVSNAAGLSPLEIEKFVTYPIEMSMRGIPGLEMMRSTTKYGLSVITLVFRDDVDIYFARQLVFERLSSAKENLPAGVDSEMGPIATAMGEIYQYTLEGQEPADPDEKVRYFTELRTLQDWVISPILKGLAGVNEINSFGGYIKQFQILLSPEKLLTYKLSVQDIFEAIEKNIPTPKREIHKSSDLEDWIFPTLLFSTAVTGIVVHILRYLGLELATHYAFAVHMMITVPMLVIEMPFGKWTHMIYRPLALYFQSLKEKTQEQVSTEGVPEYVAG